MNGRTAKILRGRMQFHPGKAREYTQAPGRLDYITGRPTGVPGTITATGARRSYQAVKRNPVLRTAILRAA